MARFLLFYKSERLDCHLFRQVITIIPVYVHSLVHDDSSPDSLLILRSFDEETPRAVSLSLHPQDADQLSLLLDQGERSPLDPFEFSDQIINTVGMEPVCVQVKRSQEGTLLATVKLRKPDREETVCIETRPADALALSLRSGAPIAVEEDLLQEIHGSPGEPDSESPDRAKTGVLKRALAKAVEEEDYERAAWIRDRLNGITPSLSS